MFRNVGVTGLPETSSFGQHEDGFRLPLQLENGEKFDISKSDIELIKGFEKGDEVEIKCIGGLLPERFSKNALKYPNATAISFKGIHTTYRELNKLSLQVAGYLQRTMSKCCLKANPIILFMEKSEMVIAAIMGIWKACGYFLPVSLSSKATLREAIRQTGAKAVITNLQKECGMLYLPNDVKVIQIAEILRDAREYVEEASFHGVGEKDTAYAIRTSGSTGKPKLCRMSHKNLSVLASAWLTKYKLDEFPVKVLQWAQISFDVFIGDLVRGLVCAPGMLCLCPDNLRLDVPYVIGLLEAHRITIAEFTPQFCKLLTESARNDELRSLRILIFGSDVLQTRIYNQIKSSLHGDLRVINGYGMTEATIDSSCFDGDIVPETQSGTVPIGKPFPGIKLHILDTKSLARCPIGEVGELYISGPVIATGDVEVTKIDGESALKTGDAARWLPCGNIELVGRLDNMLKIRGYRISSSEIENVILEHVEEARSVVVMTAAQKTKGANEMLFAYIVPKDPGTRKTITITTYVRRCLSDKVPSYMIPDHVFIIDKIPLTTNGKIDRKCLAGIAMSKDECEFMKTSAYTCKEPGTLSPTCVMIMNLFKEALFLDSKTTIQPDIPFMDQGGNSLVLVRLWSLIHDRTSLKVKIADIYSYHTVLSLAEFLDKGRRGVSRT